MWILLITYQVRVWYVSCLVLILEELIDIRLGSNSCLSIVVYRIPWFSWLSWLCFAPRWQRVVLSWSLSDGLWLYTDSQFRGWTKTPKSVPRDVVAESADFVVGRKNVGPDVSPAEFSIGSLAVFPRFLEKKDVEKVFGGKSKYSVIYFPRKLSRRLSNNNKNNIDPSASCLCEAAWPSS